jgi:hypothetical protein
MLTYVRRAVSAVLARDGFIGPPAQERRRRESATKPRR